MPDLARIWRVLKRRVLLRKVPHTLVSWRFLLPCGGAIGLHRSVFLRAWPELPRLIYAGVVLYSLGFWFGYQGWAQMLRAYLRQAAGTAEQEGIQRLEQIGQLLVAVSRGIPPHCYYGMQLYHVAPAQWWAFVFEHELPHWHTVMQGKPSYTTTQRLLADKAHFAAYLHEQGLGAVPTLLRLKAGAEPPWSELFEQRDLFFKPVSASRAEGCFSLRFNRDTKQYSMQDSQGLTTGELRIRPHIQQYLQQRDYLVQPLLFNESALEAQLVLAAGLSSERITTLRIITSSGPAGIDLQLGNLERSGPDYKRWKLYALNLINGDVEVEGQRIVLPNWPEIVRLVKAAHALCADQLTVGWDVVMTDAGPLVLEGNINWGVQAHQLLPRVPLLDGPMRTVYTIRGRENAH